MVKLLCAAQPGYSYPSGHGTEGWLIALLLGELDPGDRLPFLRFAAEVGYLRIVGGMHYQTDVIAGRTLAEQIFAQLMAQPAFTAELNAVKAAEWASPPKL